MERCVVRLQCLHRVVRRDASSGPLHESGPSRSGSNVTSARETIRNTIVNCTYIGELIRGKQQYVRKRADGSTILQRAPPNQRIAQPCPALASKELWSRR